MPPSDDAVPPRDVLNLGRPRNAPTCWRSFDELAGTPEFDEFLHSEFPQQASAWADPVSRRTLLKLMGGTLALAGLGACAREPVDKIVPYVRVPEDFVPGTPLFFATAMSRGGFARGVLVESHLGRPIKIEGNPQHPASVGATDAVTQASVLDLYDPDRSRVVSHTGRISGWLTFLTALRQVREQARVSGGAGLRIVTETVTSPSLAAQIQALLAELPAARWHQYEPIARDNARAGTRQAFGVEVHPTYRFANAAVVVSLDEDFLGAGPAAVRYARDFVQRRDPRGGAMSRLYVVESMPSISGAMADHRLPLRSADVEGLARAVARAVGVDDVPPVGRSVDDRLVAAIAGDLLRHRGESLVIAGESQPPAVHALAHAINHILGNDGRTVVYSDPVEAAPADSMASIRELADDMRAGRVNVLLILGGNPVFTAPHDLRFSDALSRVELRIHLSQYEDETSALCHWHIPETHYLESWGDLRAYDGTVTIVQPLIAPLYSGKSAHEVLAALAGQPDRSSYDVVREFWQKRLSSADFEKDWQVALHDGVIAGTALPVKSMALRAGWLGSEPRERAADSTLEICFRPDPCVWDGRFANNAWLQELPKPITKLTWDNAACLSPATAGRLGVANGMVVELRYRGASVRAPAWIVAGHADDSVTVHLGYGRTRAGRVGSGVGFDAGALRTTNAPWFDAGLEIARTGDRYPLFSTQHHSSMENRHLIRVATADEFRERPDFARLVEPAPPRALTLYPLVDRVGYAWGMSVDLNACIGCGACVTACQAENNVPVVGKEEVGRGREMHWIRVDRYFEGQPDRPAIHHQPVMCMHCENAPCELVCPVGATVHSEEGLNQMVYNRCVGTRYCSNNCPYKVRRFNFFQYADWSTPSLKPLRNPDVTVRSRGVMEKCTYCVQRINTTKIRAEEEHRLVRDGEIVTACQAVCPAQAIVFGDTNDPNSRVSRLKADPRSYGLLTDLNTRPRTTYLARITNPNPELP
jgi:molybdopterin-containing oxidoreductase family iron-sulfur binding subunit